jgi:hypothetical protein
VAQEEEQLSGLSHRYPGSGTLQGTGTVSLFLLSLSSALLKEVDLRKQNVPTEYGSFMLSYPGTGIEICLLVSANVNFYW